MPEGRVIKKCVTSILTSKSKDFLVCDTFSSIHNFFSSPCPLNSKEVIENTSSLKNRTSGCPSEAFLP